MPRKLFETPQDIERREKKKARRRARELRLKAPEQAQAQILAGALHQPPSASTLQAQGSTGTQPAPSAPPSTRQRGGFQPGNPWRLQKGKDPRRNLNGRPKDHNALQEMIRDIGSQMVLNEATGEEEPAIVAKIRAMMVSNDPRDTAQILEHGWGKVPDRQVENPLYEEWKVNLRKMMEAAAAPKQLPDMNIVEGKIIYTEQPNEVASSAKEEQDVQS